MSRTLYIFVKSLNPNTYVNSISHCVMKQDVTNVVFLGIKKSHERVLELAQLVNNIHVIMKNLCKGIYSYYDRTKGVKLDIDLSLHYSDENLLEFKYFFMKIFEKLNENFLDSFELVEYKELQYKISLIKRTKDAIFDVTATTNDIVSDLVSISITEGISSLYTFTFKDQPLFGSEGWRSLIYELSKYNSYHYLNLLDTDIYKDCIYRLYGTSNSKNNSISDDDIKNQKELLDTHRKTLQIYIVQKAKLGSLHCPPEIEHSIKEIRQHIIKIKSTLRGWGQSISDLPDDDGL